MIITDPYHPNYPVQTVYLLYIPADNDYTAILINDSSLNCNILFANGQNMYWPANDRRAVRFSGQMSQSNFNITVTALQIVPPINFNNRFVFEVYGTNECIPETYPMPLIRGVFLVPSH